MGAPYARIVRRETHSPRTVAAIVLASLVILACVYAGLELVLRMLEQPPLLVTPDAALAWLAALPTLQPQDAITAGGIAVALIGLLLMLHAILPGRTARHQMLHDNFAVLVDNGVLASSIAHRVETVARVPRGQAVVAVSHRRASIDVTPTSGIPIDESAVRAAVDDEIASYKLTPRLQPAVRIKPTGAVGS
ncbi:hypothetical protein RCH12_002203 [Cryobacterium sp. MP_3.1]|uniref:DUF6286 domain-containing protein n=1 Tax=Cryobacterium sp. MP_3.1 TaxID=3071711 RepID=UPI002E00BDBA|nr:hypothetical protein [Cryobacterium sp. MP_3.1]